jgi:hypothetical protein
MAAAAAAAQQRGNTTAAAAAAAERQRRRRQLPAEAAAARRRQRRRPGSVGRTKADCNPQSAMLEPKNTCTGAGFPCTLQYEGISMLSPIPPRSSTSLSSPGRRRHTARHAAATATASTDAMLPPPKPRCRCHCRAAAPLTNALPLPPKSCFRLSAASATKLAAGAAAALPPPRCCCLCHHRACIGNPNLDDCGVTLSYHHHQLQG